MWYSTDPLRKQISWPYVKYCLMRASILLFVCTAAPGKLDWMGSLSDNVGEQTQYISGVRE